MRGFCIAVVLLAVMSLSMSCSKAEQTAHADPVGEDGEDERHVPDVLDPTMPVDLQEQVEQLAEEQEAAQPLTEEEWQRALEILEEYHPSSGMKHPDTRTFFTSLGARVSLVAARLLVDESPPRRISGLDALAFARPTRDTGLEAIELFDAGVARPLLLRTTYDVDGSVRRAAFVSLCGIARRSRRGIGTMPPEIIPRAKELLADPDPGMRKSAAHFLWEFGELDLLTPEQIEAFEKGPRE